MKKFEIASNPQTTFDIPSKDINHYYYYYYNLAMSFYIVLFSILRKLTLVYSSGLDDKSIKILCVVIFFHYIKFHFISRIYLFISLWPLGYFSIKLFIISLGGIASGIQGFLLFLCSGINPGESQRIT